MGLILLQDTSSVCFKTVKKVLFSPMSICLLVGWFVIRTRRKLLNRFPWNLDGGRVSAQNRPRSLSAADEDKGTEPWFWTVGPCRRYALYWVSFQFFVVVFVGVNWKYKWFWMFCILQKNKIWNTFFSSPLVWTLKAGQKERLCLCFKLLKDT